MDINTITQMISAAASVVTALVTFFSVRLLIRELKSVERNQKATTVQNIAAAERELWFSVIEDETMSMLMAGHLKLSPEFLEGFNLSAENALRIMLFFRQYENIYYQHRHEMLPDKLWDNWLDNMKYTFADKRLQALFHKVQSGYSAEFRDFAWGTLIRNKPETSDYKTEIQS